MSSNKFNRRQFVKSATAASLAAPYVLTHSALAAGKTSANDRINLGFIGIGMMGRGHLGRFLGYDDVQVTAICEIEKTRRENALKRVGDRYGKANKSGTYQGCESYTDFRKLLANKEIDAVVIATPDHRRNWLDCLRSRKPTICPAEVGHRSASICHLANIVYWLRRRLTWDPQAERFTGDAEANKLLSREPREPWSYT